MPDLDAGAYAAFVWPAFGLTALAFIAMIVSSLAHARRWRRRAESFAKALDTKAKER
jgi:heme exporter protein D